MKTITLFGGLSILALAAAAGVATAQTPSASHADHRADHRAGDRGQASRDADHDGRISQAEFLGDRVVRLTALDADRDGAVSAEERRAGMAARRAERTTARFDRLDADKDGAVSRAEFDASRADRRADRGERGGRGDHMGGRGHRGGHGSTHAGRGGGERDGPVVIADVQARMVERFTAVDTNRDGFLSADEQTAAHAARREARQARRAEHRAQRQASPSAPASE